MEVNRACFLVLLPELCLLLPGSSLVLAPYGEFETVWWSRLPQARSQLKGQDDVNACTEEGGRSMETHPV